MTNIKDIITLCKNGQIDEAIKKASDEYEITPNDVWVQRTMGWALYYQVRSDLEHGQSEQLLNHAELLLSLSLLTPEQDAMIIDNLLWKLAEFLKLSPKDNTALADSVFNITHTHCFRPSKAYSFLLKCFLAFKGWDKMQACLEWWNLDNLMPEDYASFKLDNGRTLMSLAEQAYIAYAKVLLLSHDREQIRAFIPKIEALADQYPDMTYPGYFCGKLLLADGANRDEALKRVMPFVYKKMSEFWVWQLLSEIYKDEPDTQLACLIRATVCNTQETFLGKVRMRLAQLYMARGEYGHARYQIDKVATCYQQQGWHIPHELEDLMRWPEVKEACPRGKPSVPFQRLTNAILKSGAQEHIAIVTHVNIKVGGVHVVYGLHKHLMLKEKYLDGPVSEGTLLRLYLYEKRGGTARVVSVERTDAQDIHNPETSSYIKELKGTVNRKNDASFAFINQGSISCYISPVLVERYKLKHGSQADFIAALVYNKKKDTWNWNAVAQLREME